MVSREISAKQQAWLAGELGWWESLGLMTPDQNQHILALYGTPEEFAARRGARALSTLSSLAALLVALGVLLLVAYNWQTIPAALRVAIVVGVLLATHAGAFVLREVLGNHTASDIVIFLACMFYGAAIWLIAQIFQISVETQDGLWWWAIGCLPFALCLDTLLLHALVAALLGIFAGFLVLGGVATGGRIAALLSLPHNGAYTVPVLAVLGLAWAYWKDAPRTVAIYVPLIAWWVVLQPFAWRFEHNPIFFIGCVGGLLILAAQLHSSGSSLAIPYRIYGCLLTAGTLVPLSYFSYNRLLKPRDFAIGEIVLVVLAVLACVLWLALKGKPGPSGYSRPLGGQGQDFSAWFRRMWPGLIPTALMLALQFWTILVHEPLVPTVLANVAMVALALWLINLGLREDRGTPFAAGVGYFLLWCVLRYIDLFGDFGGMIGAALMFFLCGLVLFGVAQYWRQRKVGTHA